jgi:hypothetical protein
MEASCNGHLEIVNYLLQNGANINDEVRNNNWKKKRRSEPRKLCERERDLFWSSLFLSVVSCWWLYFPHLIIIGFFFLWPSFYIWLLSFFSSSIFDWMNVDWIDLRWVDSINSSIILWSFRNSKIVATKWCQYQS